MKYKRFLAVLLIFSLSVSLTACGTIQSIRDRWGIVSPSEYSARWEEESSQQEQESSLGTLPESSTLEGSGDSSPAGMEIINTSTTITVEGDSGTTTINRPRLQEVIPMGVEGTWTIFVYLCGTDLESGYGMATLDMEEMLAATGNDNVRFVVETGGTRQWQNYTVSSRENGRFLIQNGTITSLSPTERSNMGNAGTLADFLKWGVENYPAANMGVIFWDHGGGSISGVCFDERENYDSLSLREIDAAFQSVFRTMTDRFEFVGFDACLMGTVEMANILASYANYMVASEEVVPGNGWDYTAIGNFLAEHPFMDGEAVGRIICDSFMTSLQGEYGVEDATMSVVDLSRIDSFLEDFNAYARSLYTQTEDVGVLGNVIRSIEQADNFGGNNMTEGYTNMVDMEGVIRAGLNYTSEAEGALRSLNQAIVYKVSGKDHRSACGLATYYPLSVQGSSELSVFADICISPYYLSFVDRLAYGGVNQGNTTDYDDETWFDDNEEWQWSSDYVYNENDQVFVADETYDDYWDYYNDFEVTGESPLITFAVSPRFDSSGYFWFQLDENGLRNTSDVTSMVLELSYDEKDLIVLGETYELYMDWDSGLCTDAFEGYWLSLPDGQNLLLYVADRGEDYTIYTSPIYLNGELTNLRLRQLADYSVIVEGTWAGIDEYGSAARDVIPLIEGDEIIPYYDSYAIYAEEDIPYYGGTYTYHEGDVFGYDYIEEGTYYYCFCIYDIYGDYYMTDIVQFTVDSDGSIYYDTL